MTDNNHIMQLGQNSEEEQHQLWETNRPPLDLTKFLTNLETSGIATQTISAANKEDVALIILNSPLTNYKNFQALYNHAGYKCCADGGANQLYNLMTSSHGGISYCNAIAKTLPDIIHGDLDSLNNHVRLAYERAGVEVTQDHDQYSTDFQKAIRTVIKARPGVRDILVLGSLGGRVDQGVGLLHELYREQCLRLTNIRIWLFSESSISTILAVGTTRLRTDLSSGIIGRNIGILPIYGRALINTSGLEWDVRDWKTEMGGMLSTSNHIMKDMIEVTTDHPVLFTVELKADE